jgi:ATP-dependent Clp protease ATP-binding subunit ClpA
MITSQGICLGEVRSQLLKLLFVGTDPSGTSKTPLSPFAKQAFERAEVISTDFEHSEVGTGHILLALLEVPGGFAREALEACGFTLETSKKELRKLFDRLASELDPTPIPSSIG